ncbi:Cox19-like CHCH family protein [Zea mays]|uniref:Cox19-like CHCH family protein n=2 Tax=Zea mays TaxID=4577 RepID=A0A1D6KZJ3_MAIZE|nr:Cox19-like CHCH family protein [Zea mays]
MPRRSSGRSAPRPAPRAAPVRNPPQPARQAPPPAPVRDGGGSMFGGIGSTIAQGGIQSMAFGTGSAMAHRAVDAVLGPRTIQHETVASEAAAAAPAPPVMNADACSIHSKAFQDCLNNYGSEISKCQFYLDMLNECRRGGVSA